MPAPIIHAPSDNISSKEQTEFQPSLTALANLAEKSHSYKRGTPSHVVIRVLQSHRQP